MRTFLLALISIAISVAAQFVLKAGVTRGAAASDEVPGVLISKLVALMAQPLVGLGFALYGVGAILWLAVLADWDVSKAYPIVGLGFVLAVVAGAFVGESIGPARTCGVALICAGVVLVAKS